VRFGLFLIESTQKLLAFKESNKGTLTMIPMGNAAGWLKRPHDITDIIRIPDGDIVSSVTLGSYTVNEREGNPGNNFAGFINALGLPNPGIKNAAAFLPDMIKRIRDSGKKSRVSIAGFDPKEYAILAGELSALGPDEIEINLGCPNVWSDGKQKPIASFVPEIVGTIIDEVIRVIDSHTSPELSVKLSPYSDPMLLAQVAEVISRNSFWINSVVTMNTFPNALAFNEDTGHPAIDQKYGGLSGKAVKHIALGQVSQLRALLPPEISIVLVGGVSDGNDVRDAELAGAWSIQIGTKFFNEGAGVFQDIVQEYVTKFE
jgi:dihydroorotate dehydrogenase (fumarate)